MPTCLSRCEHIIRLNYPLLSVGRFLSVCCTALYCTVLCRTPILGCLCPLPKNMCLRSTSECSILIELLNAKLLGVNFAPTLAFWSRVYGYGRCNGEKFRFTKIQNGGWRPSSMKKNDYNFTTHWRNVWLKQRIPRETDTIPPGQNPPGHNLPRTKCPPY